LEVGKKYLRTPSKKSRVIFEGCMTETKTVRLDISAYDILDDVKKNLNAQKKRMNQAENATFSDAVRNMRTYVPGTALRKEKVQAQDK
jgi:hypothetical protein